MIFGSIILSSSLNAQKIKFGDIPLEDLKMEVYEHDSAAGAVILHDVGEFDGNNITFTRHIRVKILKKSGLDWGNWIFNTPSKGNFKVLVFNLEYGVVNKERANSNDIYMEDVVDDFIVTKVFAPNVKVGSVIDILYTHSGVPLEWRFQERIPIRYSNLKMSLSKYVKFNRSFYGFEPIETVSENEWKATNMPAFRFEPYLNNYTNYITKFEFQPIPSLLDLSWKTINEILMKSTRFGGILRHSNFLDPFAEELKAKDITDLEKIRVAYQYVKENIKWNGEKSIWGSVAVRTKFTKDHSGNSADINLILASLLLKVGINCKPIVLSTRDNGTLDLRYPSIYKLNYVVILVQHGDITMKLDATEKNLVPGLLPTRCINGSGIIVEPTGLERINLNENDGEYSNQYVKISISPEMTASAHISQQYRNYSYLQWADQRDKQSNDDELFLNEIKKSYAEIDIQEYKVKSRQSEKAKCTESLKIDLTDRLLDLGSEVIFNPIVMFEFDENPFKAESRRFPIDLTCKKNIKSTISISVPENFSVVSIPEPVKLTNPEGTAIFTFYTTSTGGAIQIKMNLKLNQSIYSATEYEGLKQFFTEVIKKVQEPVQLQKV